MLFVAALVGLFNLVVGLVFYLGCLRFDLWFTGVWFVYLDWLLLVCDCWFVCCLLCGLMICSAFVGCLLGFGCVWFVVFSLNFCLWVWCAVFVVWVCVYTMFVVCVMLISCGCCLLDADLLVCACFGVVFCGFDVIVWLCLVVCYLYLFAFSCKLAGVVFATVVWCLTLLIVLVFICM